MGSLSLSLHTISVATFILLGVTMSEEIAESQQQSLTAPYYNYNTAEVGGGSSPYYADYYSQPSAPSGLASVFSVDRQGFEAILTAPLVLTAFIAALFGGFLSPLISQGLASLREYEIRMPEIVRRNQTVTTTETSRMFDFIQQLTEDNERGSTSRSRRKDV